MSKGLKIVFGIIGTALLIYAAFMMKQYTDQHEDYVFYSEQYETWNSLYQDALGSTSIRQDYKESLKESANKALRSANIANSLMKSYQTKGMLFGGLGVLAILLACLKPKSKKQPLPVNTKADDIIEYKKLLDSGIITQEEYDKKKAEFLNR